MAKMAEMGEYWGNGQGVPKQKGEESCNVVVLFRAWLQRSGSSLGEVVGRVEVEDESRRGRCRRRGRVMAKTALSGRPRQAMCALGAGPRGFFFQQKSAQYSASGIGWAQTTFQTLSPDAQLACELP